MESLQSDFVLQNYDRNYSQYRYLRHEFYVSSESAEPADIPDQLRFASSNRMQNSSQPIKGNPKKPIPKTDSQQKPSIMELSLISPALYRFPLRQQFSLRY